jgi:hypothetical protein
MARFLSGKSRDDCAFAAPSRERFSVQGKSESGSAKARGALLQGTMTSGA